MRESVPSKKLDFWITHNYNVLLEGKHGVGKTSAVLEAFKKHDLKYLYFSCSTLDPWVDFVGIPKEFTDPITGITYLDLVRPKPFAFDDVQVIFLDEMNRAPAKVTNALMELLQFKSINGKKLNNLKMVWAAINPPAVDDKDPQYHVQELDPAIRTRFQVKYTVPFKLAESYFENMYGKDISKRLVSWWDELPKNIQHEFPPREVEHALKMLKDGGDINDTLPYCIKKTTFLKALEEPAIIVAPTSTSKTGIQSKANIINLDLPSLKNLSRDGKVFGKELALLSNEEFVQMFSRVGPTKGNSLSIIGQRMLQVGTKEQVKAISKIDFSDTPRQYDLHISRVLERICKERKIVIDTTIPDVDDDEAPF